MRAALLEKAGPDFSLVSDIQVEEPRGDQVLVRVHNCGLCHSDMSSAEMGGGPLPLILGHEAAGIVEAVGPDVTRLAKGDKVVMSPLAPCGYCYFCVRGQTQLCPDAQKFMTGLFPDGTTPFSRNGRPVHRGLGVGGFGEYAMLTDKGAVKIDPDTPLEIACVEEVFAKAG